jgi:hypothetical protein
LLTIPLEEHARQGLGKHVSQHVMGGDVEEDNFLVLDTLPDEVVPGVDVFCLRMMLGVLCQCFHPFIIDVEGNGSVWL